MKKEFNLLDNILTQLEIMQEKAKIICEDLGNEYFPMDYDNSRFLEYYQKKAAIKNDIVFDYLCQIENKLQELRALME